MEEKAIIMETDRFILSARREFRFDFKVPFYEKSGLYKYENYTAMEKKNM